MTNFALVENNIVTNIAVVPQDQAHRGDDYMAKDLGLGGTWVEAGDASIGWMYKNGELVPPAEPEPMPEPMPSSMTRRQGRLALLNVGKLDDVEAAIDAIEDAIERRAAQIEYEADTWERSNTFLQQLWSQLGGTEQELDDLFKLGTTL